MDDYLNEQEQWEQVKSWLRANVPWMLGGVVIAAAALGGWNWWQGRKDSAAMAAHARYQEAIARFGASDVDGGLKLVDQLRSEQPGSSYAAQAQLVAARIEVDAGKAPQAAERLATLLDDRTDPQLALVARLRLARLQIDAGKADEAIKTLAAAQPGAFAPRYEEVRGDALLAKGDRAGALQAYRSARASGGQLVDTELLDLKINDLDRS